MSEDRELLQAWRAGDRVAGNKLVRRHFSVVYRFFRNKVDGAAEELVQRTFLACVESVDRFRGDGSFRAFVLGIARMQLLRHYRALYPNAPELADTSVNELVGSPSQVAADREEQRVLLHALRTLPLDLQMVVELYYWEDMPLAEIGECVGVPEGTVKSRLSRARGLMRTAIEDARLSAELRDSTLSDLDRWARALKELIEHERS